MALLDYQETIMFSKWHGTDNLQNNEEFWNDCMRIYEGKTVALPAFYTDELGMFVTGKVKCPPGDCGDCCRTYDMIFTSKEELETLEQKTGVKVKTHNNDFGDPCLDTHDGCQFLKDNSCSVYDCRPMTCKMFPVLRPKLIQDSNGNDSFQLIMRLKCKAALDVIRKILVYCCDKYNAILLPDLTLVTPEGNFDNDIASEIMEEDGVFNG